MDGLIKGIKGISIKDKEKGRVSPSFPKRRFIISLFLVSVMITIPIIFFLFLSPYGEPPYLSPDDLDAALSAMDGWGWQVRSTDKESLSRMFSCAHGTVRTERGGRNLLLSFDDMTLSFISSDGCFECRYGRKQICLQPFPDGGKVRSFLLSDGELTAVFLPL